ncbi:ImmA/IrrE family metallo-endopeptidase [Agrobacterium vitis]|uniref:XRE family transcriptional regulator n=1 Tax=Rhizobium/Agrobacterium group TaxID=227290 RepID=UPI001F31B392|nr:MULTISPECIES: XRE family transcriptional regulator [Rhizobium/Agrobacterium group]MCF1501714.1 ImmA/IrrE family metallo-endopeptidase [Allorhizobium sp. Av2]MCM2438500.1 ImmA/IrrE family metallo-endopeptidase [Agrobacterium vitis]MCM2473164.1 ImmA/IrrE family metallo-endopeptidase [Rhizobium sp. CG5]
MGDLNELSAQEIGRRLRIARENAEIRQDDAAQVIGMSRPTLVSIEKGVRRVRIQEIQMLARHYGVSVNALLRREAVHTDLMPRFRKLRETEDAHTNEAVQLFNDLIKADVELENILGIQRRRNYPPERGINEGDVVALAEKHAKDLRDWLGLGPGPIADIFSVIDLGLGIRLYQRRLSSGSKVAGLFTYDESVGACILLNANHPLPRRIQSAAHELGHFYGTRQTPEVLEDDEKFLSRDERYANAFGRAFVTPAESFSESFRQLKEITGKTTRRLIILLAQQYNISRQACALRLEELGLAKKGTWAWFENNGGITDEHVQEVLGEMTDRRDPAKSDADRPISHRMSLMAHAAWKRELMSEGQLAELLKVGRVELRGIIDQIELEERETDELLKLPD